MTQEDKQLLLKDLCARLPYGVKVQFENKIVDVDYISGLYEEVKLDILDNYTVGISEVIPFLHPMSSMTEEEKKEFESLGWRVDELDDNVPWNHNAYNVFEGVDWLNAHYFDYRGLIERGLAIEAPEGMYK